MDLLNRLAERNISKSLSVEKPSDLPRYKEPLEIEDLSLVPETLRAGYILLKSNGFLPRELELKGEIRSVEALIANTQCSDLKSKHLKKLRLLKLHLGVLNNNILDTADLYQEKLVDKLANQK